MKYLSIAALLISMIACKKQENKAYSTWVINGRKYSSNSVTYSKYRNGECSISTNNYKTSNFGFGFWESLTETNVSVEVVGQRPAAYANITAGFSEDTMFYTPSRYSHTYTHFEKVGGKLKWKLDSTWCVNYYNASDSVLIYGSFSEP